MNMKLRMYTNSRNRKIFYNNVTDSNYSRVYVNDFVLAFDWNSHVEMDDYTFRNLVLAKVTKVLDNNNCIVSYITPFNINVLNSEVDEKKYESIEPGRLVTKLPNQSTFKNFPEEWLAELLYSKTFITVEQMSTYIIGGK